MQIESQKDFYSGIMFTTIGIVFAWGATNYSIGTGARMGPGYFPLILGALMALVGVAISVKALVINTPDGEKIGKWAWKPLFFVISANLVFGLMLGGLPSLKIPAMGLIAGIYALTFIASLGGEEFKLKEIVILATLLAIMSYLAFIVLLKLQFPVWPTFIAG